MQDKYPFYIKSTAILLGLCLFTYMLFVLRGVMVPLCFAGLLAILLTPLVNLFLKWKLGNGLSITLAILVAIIVFVGVGYFVSSQIAGFSDELPKLKEKSEQMFRQFQKMLRVSAGMPTKQQNQYITELEGKLKPMVGETVSSILGILGDLLLLPIYTFLLLYYRNLIVNFVYEVFKTDPKKVGGVLKDTNDAIKSYMVGLLLEALIVAALNITAFLIIGVKYALLLGIIGAILNMLPYIGGLVAMTLPVMMSLVTKDGFSSPLLIICAYLLIQFIDNNFLVPLIVSSKVKINALISILIVLLGGALWGVSGMFLSIPFIGVLKIIFDRIEDLKPWGKLLGDEIPTRHKGMFANFRKDKKSVAEEIVD